MSLLLLALCAPSCASTPRPISADPAPVVVVASVASVQSAAPEPIASASEPPVPRPPPLVDPEPWRPVRQEGNRLRIPAPVRFEVGKATILPESEPVLSALATYLVSHPQLTLMRVEGHTDNLGAAQFNLALSGARALAITRWLVRNGVDQHRLIAVGFGDIKPVADNRTQQGRDQNRRMEFIVAEVAGQPWLGADPIGGGTVFGPKTR